MGMQIKLLLLLYSGIVFTVFTKARNYTNYSKSIAHHKHRDLTEALLGKTDQNRYIYMELRPWQTRKHCCGNIVADANVSASKRRNICRGRKMFLKEFRNCVSATNVACAGKRGNIYVRKNVSATDVSATMFPQQCFLVCHSLLIEKAQGKGFRARISRLTAAFIFSSRFAFFSCIEK